MVQYIESPATITVKVTMSAGYPTPTVELTIFSNSIQIATKTMTIAKGQTDSLVAQISTLGSYTIIAHAKASNQFGIAEGDSAPIEIVVGEKPIISWG